MKLRIKITRSISVSGSTFVRWILAAVIICVVYREAGPWTALFAMLITIRCEMIDAFTRRFLAEEFDFWEEFLLMADPRSPKKPSDEAKR